MQKSIAAVNKMGSGHLMLEFEDGTKQAVNRGDHEAHNPAVGDLWPPHGYEHVADGVSTGTLRRV
jgi:hypothetical protein